eukprot:GFUD01005782.1.p1 GENE.GFUD01005782.1~~GFUD01005782.1.p1  ORF type:complete len:601 (-),score=146.44 GFUD01005782.1:180-1982(-)
MNFDQQSEFSGIMNTIETKQYKQPIQPGSTVDVRDVRDNLQEYTDQGKSIEKRTRNSLCSILVPADQKPFVKIVEQPASHRLRFRYQCEGRGAGSLRGETSTVDRKTFPTIQIIGYKGPATVVVSCVTPDSDQPRAHPHKLVSPASVVKDGCKQGVCAINIINDDMTVEFHNLGIQCVKKKDIGDALNQRQRLRIDPYKQGFGHAEGSNFIDMNVVKLCFQVFLKDQSKPDAWTILSPVCSKPIVDAKARKELQLMDISDKAASVEGGKKIIILCEKVKRDDIKVRFFDPGSHWEDWGDFDNYNVHKQYAIAVKTPKYHNQNITENKKVFLELVKPSDGSRSDPQEFLFIPLEKCEKGIKSENQGFPDTGKHETSTTNLYNGEGCINILKNEVKTEASDITWTTQAGHMSTGPQAVLAQASSELVGVRYNNNQQQRSQADQQDQQRSQACQQEQQRSPACQQEQQGQHLNIRPEYTNVQEQQQYIKPDVTQDQHFYYNYSHLQSPYTTSQHSLDSQEQQIMKVISGTTGQNNLDTTQNQHFFISWNKNNLEVKTPPRQISGKLFIPAIDPNHRVGRKRSRKDSENDLALAIIPRQMDRQQ